MRNRRFETILQIHSRIGTFTSPPDWTGGELLSAMGAWPVVVKDVPMRKLCEMVENCEDSEVLGYLEIDTIDKALRVPHAAFYFPYYVQAATFKILYGNDNDPTYPIASLL